MLNETFNIDRALAVNDRKGYPMNHTSRQSESQNVCSVPSVPFDVVQFVREHDAAGERLTVVHRHGRREGLVTRFSMCGPTGDWRTRRRQLRDTYRAAPDGNEQLVAHLERLGRIVDWSR